MTQSDDREASGWTPEKNERMKAEMLESLSRIVQEFEPSMVMNFVVLVETVDDNGARGLWTCESEGITPWQTMGMLQYAQAVAKARVVWRETPAIDNE